MSETVAHALFMAWRQLRNLARQPWFVAITLALPVVMLLLASSLFSRIASLPGFEWESYLTFLAPGLVVMGALFSGGWSGIGVLGEIERGVMDRFLVTPVRRRALVAGRLVHVSVLVVIQSAILIVLAEIRGASFDNGLAGMFALVAVSVLLAAPVCALSVAIALTTRTYETLIAGITMVLVPLVFLSTLYMPGSMIPHWILVVAAYNPVDWASTAGREAVGPHPDWAAILLRFGYLAALTLVCATVAVRAFRSYLRSV